eukprot:scaffold7114_cov264-Pinguiococcus_pyrenoidosus.AAC.3
MMKKNEHRDNEHPPPQLRSDNSGQRSNPIRRIEVCVCRTVQRETNPPVEVAHCSTGTFLEKLHALLVRTSQSGPRLRLTHLVTHLERKT